MTIINYLVVMDTRYIMYLLLITQFFQSCDECKPDKYGEILELVVPITTSPSKDTFAIGDTISFKANFTKEIQIYNTNNTIRLDSFDFFGLFGISEISDSFERFNINIDTIVTVGQLGYLPLYDNAVAYPVTFLENDSGYHLEFKIVLNSSGIFWIRISAASFFYDKSNYDHPALYVCDNNRRDRIDVYYENASTSFNAYNNIFLKTKVDYLLQVLDYENFQKGGGISIFVQ